MAAQQRIIASGTRIVKFGLFAGNGKLFSATIAYPLRSLLSGVFFRSWIKGALVLEVLLGLTWAFGVSYVNAQTVAFAYIFTILNSLQGAFIFVFHCLMNEKVRGLNR